MKFVYVAVVVTLAVSGAALAQEHREQCESVPREARGKVRMVVALR